MFTFDLASRSDSGLVRGSARDAARSDARLAIALVTDTPGELDCAASRRAAETLVDTYNRVGGPGSVDDTEVRLVAAAHAACACDPRSDGSRTTNLIAIAFAPRTGLLVGMGDSRCYHLRGGVCDELLSSGDPSVCTGDAMLRIQRVAAEPGDIFVLCSSGLAAATSGGAIAELVRASDSALEACARLVGSAWGSGVLDSIAVSVVRLVPHTLSLAGTLNTSHTIALAASAPIEIMGEGR